MVEVLVIDHEVTEQVAEWRAAFTSWILPSKLPANVLAANLLLKWTQKFLKHSSGKPEIYSTHGSLDVTYIETLCFMAFY